MSTISENMATWLNNDCVQNALNQKAVLSVMEIVRDEIDMGKDEYTVQGVDMLNNLIDDSGMTPDQIRDLRNQLGMAITKQDKKAIDRLMYKMQLVMLENVVTCQIGKSHGELTAGTGYAKGDSSLNHGNVSGLYHHDTSDMEHGKHHHGSHVCNLNIDATVRVKPGASYAGQVGHILDNTSGRNHVQLASGATFDFDDEELEEVDSSMYHANASDMSQGGHMYPDLSEAEAYLLKQFPLQMGRELNTHSLGLSFKPEWGEPTRVLKSLANKGLIDIDSGGEQTRFYISHEGVEMRHNLILKGPEPEQEYDIWSPEHVKMMEDEESSMSGLIIDEKKAHKGPCHCTAGKELCWKPGVLGTLKGEQVKQLCRTWEPIHQGKK